MAESTCMWPDGCDAPRHGCGLCKRHWQRAKRSGHLEEFRTRSRGERQCEWCGNPIPANKRPTATYCSKRCYNAAYKVFGSARPTVERQREYALASYRRRRKALLAEIGERFCKECSGLLPPGVNLRRAYCSRACINKASLREKREQRLEANRRRRARMIAARSPGVSERDWQRLTDRFDGRCAYCGEIAPLTMDHVVPISRGGWHAIGNILPACFSCNASKRDDLLIYWLNGRAQARLKGRSL